MFFCVLYDLMGARRTRVHFDVKASIHFTSPKYSTKRKFVGGTGKVGGKGVKGPGTMGRTSSLGFCSQSVAYLLRFSVTVCVFFLLPA